MVIIGIAQRLTLKSRLLLAVVPGKRTVKHCCQVVYEVK